MSQLVKAKQIVTKDGELIIRLQMDLNININGPGVSMASATAQAVPQEGGSLTHDEDEPEWLVPTFTAGPKLDFGKKTK